MVRYSIIYLSQDQYEFTKESLWFYGKKAYTKCKNFSAAIVALRNYEISRESNLILEIESSMGALIAV